MSVRGIKQEPHQYGKERVPLGVLEESLVSGPRRLFAPHLIDSKILKRHNVSNVLQIIAKGHSRETRPGRQKAFTLYHTGEVLA